MPKPIITVIGSFAVGMTIRTIRMPIFGETLVGADFDMGPGGKGSNQAVATARLGANPFFAGIIGDDKLGEIATDLYAREGVDITYLRKTNRLATGVGFIILNEAGENGIILDMSANKLPKLDFQKGTPLQCRTMVVIPAMLTHSTEVESLLSQLELHYLCNTDRYLTFALLTDFADAPQERMPEDEALIAQARQGLEALNRRHDHRPFYLFHRRRLWNSSENAWIGWERKRAARV